MECIGCSDIACVGVQQKSPKCAMHGTNMVMFYYCKACYNKIYPE